MLTLISVKLDGYAETCLGGTKRYRIWRGCSFVKIRVNEVWETWEGSYRTEDQKSNVFFPWRSTHGTIAPKLWKIPPISPKWWVPLKFKGDITAQRHETVSASDTQIFLLQKDEKVATGVSCHRQNNFSPGGPPSGVYSLWGKRNISHQVPPQQVLQGAPECDRQGKSFAKPF